MASILTMGCRSSSFSASSARTLSFSLSFGRFFSLNVTPPALWWPPKLISKSEQSSKASFKEKLGILRPLALICPCLIVPTKAGLKNRSFTLLAIIPFMPSCHPLSATNKTFSLSRSTSLSIVSKTSFSILSSKSLRLRFASSRFWAISVARPSSFVISNSTHILALATRPAALILGDNVKPMTSVVILRF